MAVACGGAIEQAHAGVRAHQEADFPPKPLGQRWPAICAKRRRAIEQPHARVVAQHKPGLRVRVRVRDGVRRAARTPRRRCRRAGCWPGPGLGSGLGLGLGLRLGLGLGLVGRGASLGLGAQGSSTASSCSTILSPGSSVTAATTARHARALVVVGVWVAPVRLLELRDWSPGRAVLGRVTHRAGGDTCLVRRAAAHAALDQAALQGVTGGGGGGAGGGGGGGGG
eukprot:scaffold70150_cov49-Phaeocystis_antarctica.AAC.1